MTRYTSDLQALRFLRLVPCADVLLPGSAGIIHEQLVLPPLRLLMNASFKLKMHPRPCGRDPRLFIVALGTLVRDVRDLE